MIPRSISDYLAHAGVAWSRLPHPRAVTAQELAQSLHTSGHRVCKSVLVESDGQFWIAALSASRHVDLAALASVLGVRRVGICLEEQVASRFPDCEVGAEPPFGRLYGLETVVDHSVASEGSLIVRAGSHDEALLIDSDDFLWLEQPIVAPFSVPASDPTTSYWYQE